MSLSTYCTTDIFVNSGTDLEPLCATKDLHPGPILICQRQFPLFLPVSPYSPTIECTATCVSDLFGRAQATLPGEETVFPQLKVDECVRTDDSPLRHFEYFPQTVMAANNLPWEITIR